MGFVLITSSSKCRERLSNKAQVLLQSHRLIATNSVLAEAEGCHANMLIYANLYLQLAYA